MAFTNSPNMNLPVPSVGSEAGPQYAFDINACMSLLDQHDHSPGRGVKITPAGLNINTTLNFQTNPATNVSTLSLTALSSASSVMQSISVAPGGGTGVEDLWYTDGAGNLIQLTKSGQVNVVASSIPGESYSGGTFIWTQTQSSLPTTPANFDIGNITLRPNIASTTFGVVLNPSSSISSSYSLFLPLPVASTSFVTQTAGGVLAGSIATSGGITQSNLASNSVGTAQLINGCVTAAKLDPSAFPTIVYNQVSSTGSLVVPANVNVIFVELCGGGGGGGGGGQGAVNGVGGGGGGGGGGGAGALLSPTYSVPVNSAGETLTITIGGAGSPGSPNQGTGAGAGGSTTVSGSLFTLVGLGGAAGGNGNNGSGSTPGTGGSKGIGNSQGSAIVVSADSINTSGGNGGGGFPTFTTVQAGQTSFLWNKGGGGPGSNGVGPQEPGGGAGGGGAGSFGGGGAGGNGGGFTGNPASTAGSNGASFGSGGGGGGGGAGSTSSGFTGAVGGSGFAGVAIISWVAPP